MSDIFVRRTSGRDAGKAVQMRYDEARDLLASGEAVRVNFDELDGQAVAAVPTPAEPSPVAPPVQATAGNPKPSLRERLRGKNKSRRTH